MKNLYICNASLILLFLILSCAKNLDNFDVKGEKMLGFKLTAPASNDTLSVNIGNPNEFTDFNWEASSSGLGSPITYTILFDKADGDFSSPLLTKQSNNNGESETASITQKELHDLAIRINSTENFVKAIWTVKANNGSPNIVFAQIKHTIVIPTSSKGISKNQLEFPIDHSYMSIDGNSASGNYSFKWGKSDVIDKNDIVKYWLLIDDIKGDFSNPIISILSDNNGADNMVTKTNEEWYALFDKKGYSSGAFKWTVKANTNVISTYYSERSLYFEATNWVLPLYIVGDAITDIIGSSGWLIDNALLVSGLSAKVNSGVVNFRNDRNKAEFKFFPKRGSWDGGIEATDDLTYIGNCKKGDGGNFVYTGNNGRNIVYVNLKEKKLTVTDAIYLIGGSTVADGNMDKAIPFTYIGDNTYQVFSYITSSGWGYKFLPTRSWDGGWGLEGTTNKITQNSANDLKVSEDGFYRVTVNFSNGITKTEKTNWGLIGTATSGGWDSDQNMTLVPVSDSEYKGSYDWLITTNLTVGKMKFRANDGWEINLGDTNLDGTLVLGGTDIDVTEAGNYTIRLILNPSGYKYILKKNF
jgi:hypothetical protein